MTDTTRLVETTVRLTALEMRRRAVERLYFVASDGANHVLWGKTTRPPTSDAEKTVWRAVYGAVHLKQVKEAEERLTVAVERFVRAQIRSAIAELRKLGTAKSAAENLSRMIFDPKEWNNRLVDVVTPALVRIMGDAALATLRLMGVHVGVKSTATEWLERQDEESPPGTITEYPDWMQRDIAERTRETMSQPYWAGISETTRNDIEQHLRRGLQDGLSIVDMAARMTETLGSAYTKARATNTARTESGHVLNAGRDVSIRRVQDSLGEAGRYVGKEWHSVLGTTTRDTHAALDGMLADEEGLWPLGGVRVPWPSHFSLPPSERCNCQCTIIMRLGVNAPENEIQAMIAEREQQIAGEPVPPRMGPRRTVERCGGLSDIRAVKGSLCDRTRAEIAKASAKRVDRPVQRYAEERNEALLAAELGGEHFPDTEAMDVVIEEAGRLHGVEMKTMVGNKKRQLSMKRTAVVRKLKWGKKRGHRIHTVVWDDENVVPGETWEEKRVALERFLETGDDTGFDYSKRRVFYRRGVGNFRVHGMHEVKGGAEEIHKLMNMRADRLPKGAR